MSFDRGSGATLCADVAGAWSADLAVLLLHGGGQTRHSWGGTLHSLAKRGLLALALDARGHGASSWDDGGDYSMDAFADDIRRVCTELDRPVILVGASLGGLSSMLAAGERPKVDCAGLVLVDVTPWIDPAGSEQIMAFMRAKPEGFESIEEAADAVAAYIPHRPRPSSEAGLRNNLRRGRDGRFHWHWDPRFLAVDRVNEMAPERYARALAAVEGPILLVRGRSSNIVTDQYVRKFRDTFPAAEYVDVPNAGHMVAGDQNDRFTEPVIEFIGRVRAERVAREE